MLPVFKVIKAGLLSTLQDGGRCGYLGMGISQSGAMDEYSYYWGNHLLNNPSNSTSLEITIGQCQLLVLKSINIAITGADLGFCINNQALPTWSTAFIKKGDILKWDKPRLGIRSYLSISGGFSGQTNFNSHSVNLRENIGQALAPNDILKTTANSVQKMATRAVAKRFIPDYQKPLCLQILLNQYDPYFKDADYQTLLASKWIISPQNDRSAYQLECGNIQPKNKTFYSQANDYGSVQITPLGVPIIMLKDRPTIGGYPKIGTVFSLDLSQLAQRTTADNITFKTISIEKAQQQRKAFNQFFNLT